MKKAQRRLFSSFIVMIMVAFLTGVSYSQSDTTKTQNMDKQSSSTKYDKEVREAVIKLKSQIDLTMQQTRKIEGIIQNYKDNGSSTTTESNNTNSGNSDMSSSNNSTLDKIEKVLTADQTTKFDQIKDQWWSDTQQSLSKTSTSNKSQSGY